jgi:predicted GNAT family N-acyltransferase
VELLCSATHTGGGKQVIREIQRQVQNRGDKGIRLVSSAYADKFYTSMGFNYNTDGLQYDREWTPNK